jgi:hypothetical protein
MLMRAILAFPLLVLLSTTRADDPPRNTQAPDTPSGLVVAQQTMQQKQAQLEAKRTAARLDAMLRVLAYHQLDDHAVQKIMSEAVGTLKGLSNQQMSEILKNFDTAAQSKTLSDMDKQLDLAQDKHRVVLDQLRTLLNRFELMRNLDQAAMRIDKLAFEEKALRERMVLAEQLRRQQANQRRGMRPESPQQLALKQEDITRESKAILQKLDELKHDLPDELKPRIDKITGIVSERKMLESMIQTANHIKYRNLREAEDSLFQAQNDLERIARTLRTPSDKLGVLQEARDRVASLVQQQTTARDEVSASQDPRQKDALKEKAQDREHQASRQSARQAEVMVQTKDVKELLTDIGKPAADTLQQSLGYMQEAKDHLREHRSSKARTPQTEAIGKLTRAQQQLEELVAAEEKLQRDPLEGIKRAIDQLDKIIADQQQLKNRTQEATVTKKLEQLKPMATRQQYLAEKTESVVAKPLAAKNETKNLIQQAAEGMHAASEQLHLEKGEVALGQQTKALQDLAMAKAALEAEAKAMEKRREEIAALEKAIEQLDQLIEQETGIHESSQQLEKQDKSAARTQAANAIQTQQAKTREGTVALAKDVTKPAPEAAKSLTAASEKMSSVQQSLKNEQPSQAAAQAKAALDLLNEAKDKANNALSEKQAEEAAAEAMQNPDKVNPAEAAIHVAKALMEAQEAAKQASQADKDQGKAQQAMKQSEDATKSAQAAVDQAKALSPSNIQKPLAQSRQNLNQAQQQLQQQSPKAAQQKQEQAAKDLQKSLQSLQQTMQAMEKMQGNEQNQEGKPQQGKDGEKGNQQGKQQQQNADGKSDKSSQGDGKDKQAGDPSQNGERDGNAKSEKANVDGKSTFVNLPARQRELIKQALSDNLPPEHAAQIQRYYESIAAGKAAGEKKK